MAGPDRLALFLQVLDRLSLDDLGMTALPEPDAGARSERFERAMAAAARAGPDRLAELEAAPRRIREHLLAGYNVLGFQPSWFGVMWSRSVGRADDRAHLISAIEDAAIAAVVDDLLPADDLVALREPFVLAASMRGTAPSINPRIELPEQAALLVAVVLVVSLLVVGSVVVFVFLILAATATRRRRRLAFDDGPDDGPEDA
ncbi:MAG: hypothetical protein QOE42_2049 [Chloroflexota bacterium]|nr:hypothetical protein [Chloroflexota bacterium]